jgi:hypothetical protein
MENSGGGAERPTQLLSRADSLGKEGSIASAALLLRPSVASDSLGDGGGYANVFIWPGLSRRPTILIT